MIIKSVDILEISEQQNCDLITYQFNLDDGSMIGPRMDRRPKNDDHQAFADGLIETMQTILDEPPIDMEQELLKTVLSFDKELVKTALSIDDSAHAALEAKLEAK